MLETSMQYKHILREWENAMMFGTSIEEAGSEKGY